MLPAAEAQALLAEADLIVSERQAEAAVRRVAGEIGARVPSGGACACGSRLRRDLDQLVVGDELDRLSSVSWIGGVSAWPRPCRRRGRW
jgi:hypothetical protein